MTLTDDDLGARLRTALQQVTPLAADPVPGPRFAASSVTAGVSAVEADVLDLGSLGPVGSPGRGGRVRRHRGRRLALAGALVAAAVAAGVLVARTGIGGPPAPTGTPAGPATPTGFAEQLAAPPTGPGDGWFVYPEIVRCEAHAGATLGATHTTDSTHLDIWTIATGVTCRTMPAERGRYLFGPPRVRDAADQPAHLEGTSACIMASTRATGARPFEADRNGDYLEFFGPSCFVRSAPR